MEDNHFFYREWDDDDEGRVAMQDQTRAQAIEALRTCDSFILTTGKDGGDEGSVESLSCFSRMNQRVFASMLQATSEAVAASWFANSGNTQESFAMLGMAFIGTARQTMRELSTDDGGEG